MHVYVTGILVSPSKSSAWCTCGFWDHLSGTKGPSPLLGSVAPQMESLWFRESKRGQIKHCPPMLQCIWSGKVHHSERETATLKVRRFS